jgi:hypothetical protein
MTAFLSLAPLLWAPAVLASALEPARERLRLPGVRGRRPLPAFRFPEAPDRRRLGSYYLLIEYHKTDDSYQE